MKRIIREFFERLKAVYHIFKDKEYAIYTVSVKNDNGELKRESACCIISDSASDMFLDTIIEFTKQIKNTGMNNICKQCGEDLVTCENCEVMGCPECNKDWKQDSEGCWICPECYEALKNNPDFMNNIKE